MSGLLSAFTAFVLVSITISLQDPFSNILRLPCKNNAIFYRVAEDTTMNETYKILENETFDDEECMAKCLLEPQCKSLSASDRQNNNITCILYSVDRNTHSGDLVAVAGTRYYDSGYFSNVVGPMCRIWLAFLGVIPKRCIDSCTAKIFGIKRENYQVGGSSCRNIRDMYKANVLPSGFYSMIGKNGNPITAYCDMESDGGGWVRIGYVNKNARKKNVTKENNLGNLANANINYLLDKQGLITLQRYFTLSQLRFECRKQSVGRTMTILTNTEEAFSYFTGNTARRNACSSFISGSNDESYLAQRCEDWKGIDDAKGVWNTDEIDSPFQVKGKYEWALNNDVGLCDDANKSTSVGIWSVYAR